MCVCVCVCFKHTYVCRAGVNDDCVVPSHSYKFVATLQHVLVRGKDSVQRNPLLLFVDQRGHEARGTATFFAYAAAVCGATWSYTGPL